MMRERTFRLPPNCLDSVLRQTSVSARNRSTGILRLHPVHAIAAHDDDLHVRHNDFINACISSSNHKATATTTDAIHLPCSSQFQWHSEKSPHL